jgi:hypothetical protein
MSREGPSEFVGRRIPVGPARELLGWLPPRRRQGAVLVYAKFTSRITVKEVEYEVYAVLLRRGGPCSGGDGDRPSLRPGLEWADCRGPTRPGRGRIGASGAGDRGRRGVVQRPGHFRLPGRTTCGALRREDPSACEGCGCRLVVADARGAARGDLDSRERPTRGARV